VSLRLKSLHLESFRSFVGADVSFPDNGLVMIRGINRDTGGSSGSGKSSINLAIAYALGYCPYPATELQSWVNDKPMSVGLGLDVPGDHSLVVKRGKGFKLELDGKPMPGGAKMLESELQRLLGIPVDIIEALTYRRQRRGGFFLSKSNADKQEFLTVVLDLKKLEAAIKTTQTRITEGERLVDLARGQVSVLEQQLARAGVPAEPITKSTVIEELELKNQQSEVQQWKAILQGIRDRIEPFKARLRAAQATREKLQGDCQRARTLVVSLEADEARLPQLEDQFQQRAQGLKVTNSAVCPTCEQRWLGPKQEQLVEKLNRDLLLLADNILVLKGRLPQLEQARTGLLDLERQLASVPDVKDEELDRLHAAHEAANAKLTEAAQACLVAGNAVEAIQRENDYGRRTFDGQMKRYRDELDVLEAARTNAAVAVTQLNAEKDFLQLVGREGFLGAIFDEVLQEIGTEATEILGKVPNTQGVSVTFRSETLTAKGTTQKGIVPVVSIRGHEAPLDSGASGGMYSAIELAVDLAVLGVVSRRLGVYPGWLVLDEPFEGLGSVEKEAYLEVLSVYGRDKLVLIVDHGTETAEFFDKIIDIDFKNGISCLGISNES
jgi:DNA repair exonuclease SbcCD ATPase subunit